MMFFRDKIIEDSNIFDGSKEEVLNVLSRVDWTYLSSTTSPKFPQNSHDLVLRPSSEYSFFNDTPPRIVSDKYEFFLGILNKFCEKHRIKYSNIIRACINKTEHVSGYSHTDPHIDFIKDHYVVLMYFDENSPTIIFDKKYSNSEEMYDVDNSSFRVKKKIYPSFGKICLFDGKYFHANEIPRPYETRIVCVFNLLK